jgi:hypothetical protein
LRSYRFASIGHSAVYELEGLRGMWRGLGPALSGVIPSRAVQFATYSFMKRTLAPILGENTSLHLVSASVAGAHRTAPHRTAPHRTAPHRTAPHRTAPHRTAPHRTV